MLDRLKTMMDHMRDHREIERMDARELGELGLSRGQLHEIVDTPEKVAARMAAMALRHGITTEDLESYRQDYVDLLHTCAHCSETDACRRFLNDTAAPAEAATFCPNHAEYTTLVGQPT
jgi:uncharacterized protein YjiS (DUF1127 family)